MLIKFFRNGKGAGAGPVGYLVADKVLAYDDNRDLSWIIVSPEMMDELRALPPKRPKNRKTGKFMKPRVFGYGSSTGYNTRWKTICKRAGIQYLSAHQAGRHGFFTELVVRQGVDPVTAAKAGRWADPNLPMRIYAHAETDEADVRARFRTNHVQEDPVQTPKQQKSKKE